MPVSGIKASLAVYITQNVIKLPYESLSVRNVIETIEREVVLATH